jgi:hypothetical protein
MTAAILTMQERIKEQIQQFDIFALMKLLDRLGYKASDIYFQSNSSLSSATSICHDILFIEKEYPRIVLTLNIGFFSNQSPLPSLFRKKMDEGSIDPVAFSKYLGFFDHYLMKVFLGVSMPEDHGWFFTDWKETLRQYLKLLALNSVSTLSLLFQLCFPELKVKVVKYRRMVSLQSSSIVLGTTLLGKESYLQKNEQLAVSGLKVVLTGEDQTTELNSPWPFEILERLRKLVFPLMDRVNVYLQVNLILENARETAHLSKDSYLSYCSLGHSSGPIQFKIFSGYPKDFKLAAV